MTWYRIETRGEARELYDIEADSEEEARELFENDPPLKAELTEVTDVEIVGVTEKET